MLNEETTKLVGCAVYCKKRKEFIQNGQDNIADIMFNLQIAIFIYHFYVYNESNDSEKEISQTKVGQMPRSKIRTFFDYFTTETCFI